MSAIYTGAPRTILLNSEYGRHVEKKAAAAVKPGHLIEFTSADKWQKHSSAGGRGLRAFAKEDPLRGYTIDDAYATDEIVMGHIVLPGDKVYAKLAAAAVAVTKGDSLASAGDGTLLKILAGGGGGVLLSSAVAASTAVSNTTTETLFSNSYTIPASFLRAGDVIRVRGCAIATATNSTNTLTLTFYIGGLTGTAIIATAAVDVADNDVGFFDVEIVLRTVGASGTFVATGVQGLGVPGTVTAKPFLKGSTAIDTTATKVLGISATWSVANSGNSCRLDVFDVTINRTTGFSIVAYADETVDNSAGADEAFIRALIA